MYQEFSFLSYKKKNSNMSNFVHKLYGDHFPNIVNK